MERTWDKRKTLPWSSNAGTEMMRHKSWRLKPHKEKYTHFAGYLKAANKSNHVNQEVKEKNPKIWGILLREPDNQKTHNTGITMWKELDDKNVHRVDDEAWDPAHGNKKGPQDRIPEPSEITSHSCQWDSDNIGMQTFSPTIHSNKTRSQTSCQP